MAAGKQPQVVEELLACRTRGNSLAWLGVNKRLDCFRMRVAYTNGSWRIEILEAGSRLHKELHCPAVHTMLLQACITQFVPVCNPLALSLSVSLLLFFSLFRLLLSLHKSSGSMGKKTRPLASRCRFALSSA